MRIVIEISEEISLSDIGNLSNDLRKAINKSKHKSIIKEIKIESS